MNTQLFIYALEVQKTGSITQAASNMFMSQPTLSKAIKELESSLGFPVFERSSKGVVPTQKGQEFLLHARRIVEQLQRMEHSLSALDGACQHFSLAMPRAGYVAQAAAEQICSLDGERRMEIDLLETSSAKVIESVAYGHYALGVVRCSAEDEAYCIRRIEGKGLRHELIWRAEYVALMRGDHPLVEKPVLAAADFRPYVEVVFGDEAEQGLCSSVPADRDAVLGIGRRILVYDRAMMLDILKSNPLAYMWVSPQPKETLQENGLVQRSCCCGGGFADHLISKNDHYFSAVDRSFIDRLCLHRNRSAYNERNMVK